MNWQKYSAIMAVVGSLVGSTYWFAQNIVTAGEFNQHVAGNRINDLRWEKRFIQPEYYNLRDRGKLTIFEHSQVSRMEERMKEIDAEIQSLRGK